MRTRILAVAAAALLAVPLAGCGSKGEATSNAPAGTLTFGASISLSNSLAREGKLTQEGYDVCKSVVNGKGGVSVPPRSEAVTDRSSVRCGHAKATS